jgi:hypothetical protein
LKNEKANPNFVRWKKYNDKVYILLKGNLDDWDKEFLTSIRSKLYDGMTENQERCLEKILDKYYSR